MQLADYAFEERLIERIALRELLREQLTPRLRRVMRLRIEGYSLQEIGGQIGVCANRALQLEHNAIERLRQPKRLRPIRVAPAPLAAPAIVTRPAFDRAAFLEHMRGLIRRRAEREAEDFERELAATHKLAKLAEPAPPKPPPLSPEELAARRAAYVARMAAERDAEQAAYAASLQAHIDAANAGTAALIGIQAHVDLVNAAHSVQASPDYQAQLQIGLARREWSGVRGAFTTEEYQKVRISRTVSIYGWRLDGGREYWLPLSVIQQLTASTLI